MWVPKSWFWEYQKVIPLPYLAGEKSYLTFPEIDLRLFSQNQFALISYLEKNAPIVYFRVAPNQEWTLCFSYLKGTYLTKPERYLMELCRQFVGKSWNKID